MDYKTAARNARKLTTIAEALGTSASAYEAASKAHFKADELGAEFETSTSFDHFHMGDMLAYTARSIRQRAADKKKQDEEDYGV